MQRVITQSLKYVVVASVAIAAANWLSGGRLFDDSDREITISLAKQQELVSGFSRTRQRPPTDAELREMINELVKDEIAYRETVRMRLGRDDVVIRRRSREVFETGVGAIVTAESLSEEALLEYLEAHPDEFAIDTLTTFRQIYFDAPANSIGADASARFLLGELNNADMPVDIEALGDPSNRPAHLDEMSKTEIQRMFGGDFAERIDDIEPGQWTGPLRSYDGLHIVFVDNRSGGHLPPLADVEEQVRLALLVDARGRAVDSAYHELDERYEVQVETPTVEAE